MNRFQKIKVAYSKYDVRSPVEKIIEIIKQTKEAMGEDGEMIRGLDWCMEVISSNRLYDPILENVLKEGGEGQKEVIYFTIFLFFNEFII